MNEPTPPAEWPTSQTRERSTDQRFATASIVSMTIRVGSPIQAGDVRMAFWPAAAAIQYECSCGAVTNAVLKSGAGPPWSAMTRPAGFCLQRCRGRIALGPAGLLQSVSSFASVRRFGGQIP